MKIIKLTLILTLFLFLGSCNRFNQFYEPICDPTGYKSYVALQDGSVFHVASNSIQLSIPIPLEKLRIKKTINISSDIINAILINVDGVGGRDTRKLCVNGLLKADFKLSKIKGLDAAKLADHKKLCVFVVHDDDFTDSLINIYQNIVKKIRAYPTGPFKIDTKNNKIILLNVNDQHILKPNESEGTVIGGN